MWSCLESTVCIPKPFLQAFLSFAGKIVIFLSKFAVLFYSVCWGGFGGVGFSVDLFCFVFEFYFVPTEILFQDFS